MDVRPATGVARREDAREGHDPVLVRGLDPAQVVLIRRGLGVQRVVGRHGRSATGRRRRPAMGAQSVPSSMVSLIVSGIPSASRGRRSEAGPDVAADDAALARGRPGRSTHRPGTARPFSSGMIAQLSPAAVEEAGPAEPVADADAELDAPAGAQPVMTNRPALNPPKPRSLSIRRRSKVERSKTRPRSWSSSSSSSCSGRSVRIIRGPLRRSRFMAALYRRLPVDPLRAP